MRVLRIPHFCGMTGFWLRRADFNAKIGRPQPLDRVCRQVKWP
jgi:hypothetical protein